MVCLKWWSTSHRTACAMALPLSPGGSVLPGYRHSPPKFTMAQPVQHLQHVPPPPGLTRAIPMHYSGLYQQQPSTGYQVLTMPMPVALPVTPALSYNTPPLMAKLSMHQQQQQQQQQQQPSRITEITLQPCCQHITTTPYLYY